MNGRGIRVYCELDPEKREAGVALAEHADTLQLTECLRKIEGATVFGDDKPARCEKRSGAKKGEHAAVFVGIGVRRIEENDVERSACGSALRGDALQAPQRVELENSCASLDAEGIEILLNESGSGRMILDEHGFGGTATEGFDADCTRASEDVEEATAGDAFSEDIEECLTEAVAGRTKGEALEAFELAAAKCPGDDAHDRFDGPQPT